MDPILLLFLILIIPIVNWFTVKKIRPKKSAIKRFPLYIGMTWLMQSVLMLFAFVIA